MADNPASITRRDFLNGIPIAVGGAVAAGVSPEYIAAAFAADPAPQDAPGYYPPALTGLRGSHPGAFEAAHRLRDGDFWSQAGNSSKPMRATISLSWAAASAGSRRRISIGRSTQDARILILDNHDDFGGHAKRNEFSLDGRIALINGGTLLIDSPRPYSAVADGLLKTLGIDPVALTQKCSHSDFYPSLGLQSQHISRQGNVRRRQADRRAARHFVGTTARRRAVVAKGAKRHRAHPGSGDRLYAGPDVGGKEDAPRGDELPRLFVERGQGRSRRHPVLPNKNPRRVGRRHRCRLRARRVGVRIPGLQRPSARARLGAAHRLHGERLRR